MADDRFWQKVQRQESGCWIWTGSRNEKGYGQVRRAGRLYRAHRYAWELLRGPIAAGMELDHLCRVRECVNPSHLEPVTRRENQLRGFGVAGIAARRPTCPRGHEYVPLAAPDSRGVRRICASYR